MINISDDRRKQLMLEAKRTIKSKNISMEPEIFEALVLKLYKELLEKEKTDFEKKLLTRDTDITFELFDDYSYLNVYFMLIEHLNNVKTSDELREIIEKFEPKYIDF